ncbi:short-chain alcohol dehydrogenase [Didymosphaeria variabile]|uniref:Short-chain alcohol dehydrogenase n=1 Tax=Didymosphaeria variabile TaxID=1932322 RepID=A0A9W8XFX7_9PLEO|nr:short-chain alcohol dehydrogenase [Didymosphaeria variabile]KAJ4349377.1 short-chain alcohol dehydrogenase [Didymosphaeria variabile]
MPSLEFMKAVWTQHYPPAPTFTEKNITEQKGKVFLITGANQGLGYELAKMLYPTGATIYMASRSEERTLQAIHKIQEAYPDVATPGTLKYLHVDMADLPSVKHAAIEFAAQEEKLDVLWNNAGIGGAPLGTTTAQGLEGHIGTNCVAPFLFTQLLLPLLRKAATSAPKGSVRVVWTGSLMIDTFSPPGGIDFKAIEAGKTTNSSPDYATSKVGNWFLSHEAAKAWGPYGIYSVVQNPGNLNTEAYRYVPGVMRRILKFLFLYDTYYGAYTMAYAGLSEEVANGEFIWPWGRKAKSPRADIYEAIEKGAAERFWKWCEEQAKVCLH